MELEEYDKSVAHARYSYFSIGSEENEYELHLGSYTGSAGDVLTYHKNVKFSTKDRRNDEGCSQEYRGGWWYKDCNMSNSGVNFNGFNLIFPRSMNLLLKKSTSMKIRGLTGVKDLFFLVKVFHIGNYNHIVTGACLFIDSSKFIFSKLFSTHLLWLVRKIIRQSIASLVGNHFLYTRELNVCHP